MANEQVVPGQFADNAHIQPMLGIRAGKQVLHIIAPALHVLTHILIEQIEFFGFHWRVVIPPNFVNHIRRTDHKFIFRAAPRKFARRHQ